MDQQEAEAIADRTLALLGIPGWCIWECENMGMERIVIIAGDHVIPQMPGWLRFALEEELHVKYTLQEITNVGPGHHKLVLEAKKQGARVEVQNLKGRL